MPTEQDAFPALANRYPDYSVRARMAALKHKTKVPIGAIIDRVWLIGLDALEKNPSLLIPVTSLEQSPNAAPTEIAP